MTNSKTVFEVVLPTLALMLVEPMLTLVTKPVLSIVAADVVLEDQVSTPRVATVPSVMMPLAVNCCLYPTKTLAEIGVIESVASTGAVTVRVTLVEVIPFREAVMLVLPCASEVALPLVFTVATVVLLDNQVAEPEIFPALPSV